MKLFLFGDNNGRWYCGRSPAGRVKTTQDFTEATMFTQETVNDAEDCAALGLSLFSIEISSPKLEMPGHGSFAQVKPQQDYKSWEVHPMNLFGDKEK